MRSYMIVSVIASALVLMVGCQPTQKLEIRLRTASEKDLMEAGRELVRAIEKGDVKKAQKLAHLHWVPVLPEANNIAMGDKCMFPIHAAAGAGDVEVLKALIAEDADVNTRDNNGLTPILWAVTRSLPVDHKTSEEADAGRIECIRELIKAGADINAGTRYRWTALHWISFSNKNAMTFLKELVKQGADINRRNDSGETPLHVWCRSSFNSEPRFKEGVKYMIDQGADLCIKDDEGRYADEVLEKKLRSEFGKEMTEILRTARLKQEKMKKEKEDRKR